MIIVEKIDEWAGGQSGTAFPSTLRNYSFDFVPGLILYAEVVGNNIYLWVNDLMACDILTTLYVERNRVHDLDPSSTPDETWTGGWYITPEGELENPLYSFFLPYFGSYPQTHHLMVEEIPLMECFGPVGESFEEYIQAFFAANNIQTKGNFVKTSPIPRQEGDGIRRNYLERVRQGQVPGVILRAGKSQNVNDLHNEFQFPVNAHDIQHVIREFTVTDLFRSFYYPNVSGIYCSRYELQSRFVPVRPVSKPVFSPIDIVFRRLFPGKPGDTFLRLFGGGHSERRRVCDAKD